MKITPKIKQRLIGIVGVFFVTFTVLFSYAMSVFAQIASPSASPTTFTTPIVTTTPTPAISLTPSSSSPSAMPQISMTPTMNETVSPTLQPVSSIRPQFANENVKHSQDGNMNLYFPKTDFQAQENPSFTVTLSSTNATPTPTPSQISLGNFLQMIRSLIAPAFAQNQQEATISAKVLDANNNAVAVPIKIVNVDQYTYQITLAKGNTFQPGSFTLVVQNGNHSVAQNFSWGVLALNMDKSIYVPGDNADLQMAVLDDFGKVLCNANLVLTITDPNNKTVTLSTADGGITVNPACHTFEVTTQPDYETQYLVHSIGTYNVKLTATTQNGTRSITDALLVKATVPFDVVRKSATRIYPPNTYPMNFTITPNQDFTGSIEEIVPDSFTVLPATQSRSYDTVHSANGSKVIIWHLSAKKDMTFSLGYNFQAPIISPQFYVLGPLQFRDTNGTVIFQEARQWQIAADVVFPATTYLSNTASAQITSTTSWQVVTAAPSSSDSTTSCKYQRATGYCQEQPGVANKTNAQAKPSAPNGKGWIYDTALDSTIPTGTWTFSVDTSNTSLTGVGLITVCAWKVKITSGAISSSTNIINCVDGTTNVQAHTIFPSSVSVASVPATSFASDEFLYVEYWLHTTIVGTSQTAVMAFQANASSGDDIVLPGASSNLAPNAPTQDAPANNATGVSTTPVFNMTATDPEADDLRYKVTIYSNSGCTTVAQTDDQNSSQTGWSGQNATISTANDAYTSGTQGTFTTQTALSNLTQYWWKASAKDPASGDSNTFTDSTSCNNFTTVSANQAPNSPTSLAQIRVTAGTTMNVGDWTNETQVKFTASVSDPDATDTLQLCVEAEPLGTSFTNTETSCGTGVAYLGTAVTATLTLTGLTDATSYHWQTRVKDAGGLYSSWVSYGGNLESVSDFGIDTTAPTGGNVYDGTTTGVDQQFNDGSLSVLSANWANFDANASGLSRYDYAIGTTAGGTDVVNWTSNGTATSITVSSLSLQTSKIYYFSIRAVDNAGNIGTGVSSDGQAVSPTLTFSFSPSSITFNNLNAGNSYTDTQNTTLTTSTNAYNGYIIDIFTTQDLTSTIYPSDTIGGFTGGTYTSPAVYGGGDTGFGVTSSAATVQGVNKFQPSGGVGTLYFAPSHAGPGDIIADHTANVTGSPISNEQFTITYKVVSSATQPASPYTTTAVYTITPQY